MNPRITITKNGNEQDRFATIEGEPFTGCPAEVMSFTGMELERYPSWSTGDMLVTKDNRRVVAVQVNNAGQWVRTEQTK